MKIKNVSQTGAYGFKANHKLVLVPAGVVVEVPADQEASVKRLCDSYAKHPETAVFMVVGDNVKATDLPDQETEAERVARTEQEARVEAEKAKLAEQEKRAAELAREKKRGGAPEMTGPVIRGADGKPIPVVK